jgi:hypothetical protein
MHDVSNFVGASLTAVSVGWVALTGVDLVVDHLTPPPVAGKGYYSEPVRAGETVNIKWVITKLTDCHGLTSRVWEGEDNFSMMEETRVTTLPKGTGVYYIPTRIPEGTPVGEVSLKIKGYYDCDVTSQENKWFILGPVLLVVVPNEETS